MRDVTMVQGYGVPQAQGGDYQGYGRFSFGAAPKDDDYSSGLFDPLLDPQHGMNGFAFVGDAGGSGANLPAFSPDQIIPDERSVAPIVLGGIFLAWLLWR